MMRGFARLDPAERRRIAASGGRAAHARGVGRQWTVAEAREAGRKGGLAKSAAIDQRMDAQAAEEFAKGKP